MKASMLEEARSIETILENLVRRMGRLRFQTPVELVYNPLTYAKASHLEYWHRYGAAPREIMLLGMNPGPWGMVQTGIPFGDVEMVTGWLDIRKQVDPPQKQHPKRPITGFDCPRSEVSGRRLWGWARERFITPQRFFERFWVANYCPLAFLEATGRNRTPDKLPDREQAPLLLACDRALVQIVAMLRPRIVVGVGKFAALQAKRALRDMQVQVGQIIHPSPANPKANAGWCERIEDELRVMGIRL